MKRSALILFLSLTVAGCGLINSKTNDNNVTANFSLTDTTGQANTTFAPGQNFNMSFLLINKTDRTVTYKSTIFPPINFEIIQGDSVIGENAYAVSNVAKSLPIKLLPGDTLKGSCEAPLSILGPHGGHITLVPGSYIAKAIFPTISGANVKGTYSSGFTVKK